MILLMRASARMREMAFSRAHNTSPTKTLRITRDREMGLASPRWFKPLDIRQLRMREIATPKGVEWSRALRPPLDPFSYFQGGQKHHPSLTVSER